MADKMSRAASDTANAAFEPANPLCTGAPSLRLFKSAQARAKGSVSYTTFLNGLAARTPALAGKPWSNALGTAVAQRAV